MTLPKYQDLDRLTILEDIEKEILSLQKILLNLRITKVANKDRKCHLLKHTKRRIAQLKFKRSTLIKLTE